MRNLHNVERRPSFASEAKRYPYRAWDANGTVYMISRPSSARTGWHAWGSRDGVKLAGDLLAAPTLSALSKRLAAHKPPIGAAPAA